MKKLLFTLVATAACGVASAAAENFSSYVTGEFSAATNATGNEVSGEKPGNWTIDMSTGPEMLITNNVADTTTGNYLQINTGNTPLWRTFADVKSVADATSGVPQATTIDDGTVVSSKVKLTACTEWPKLESFWGEKLALFLYAPEDEAAAASHPGGLYAVGGTWITVDEQPVFTNKAYKLAIPAEALDDDTGAITNTYGWAKIDIKAYTNVLSVASSYSGFIVAVNGNLVTVDTNETDYIGLGTRTLSNAAQARFEDKELILAAATGQFAGLGFQGEGGIDDVDLAAAGINDMKDAAMMTVSIVGAAELKEVAGGTLDDGKVTFTPGATVTFKVDSAAEIVKVTYKGVALEADENGVYTIKPEANAELVVTASDAAFQIGEGENAKKYATLAEALAGLKSGDTLKLLGTLEVDSSISFTDADKNAISEIELDLNGQTIVAKVGFEDNLIYNVEGTKLTIIDSSAKKTGTVDGGVANEGELIINAGKFNGAVTNGGTLTDNGGKFRVKDDLPEVTGKEYRDDDADGYYTLVDKAGDAPTVDDENATITPDGQGNYVVETEEESLEISLPENFDKKVVIPATVNSVSGVAIGQLKVMATVTVGETTQSFDIAGVLKIEDGKLVLDETKAKPALAEEDPLVVGDTTAVSVKTIPGLKYSLVYDSDLSFESDAKGETAAVPATTTSMTLTDDSESKPTKRFYKVKVTK